MKTKFEIITEKLLNYLNKINKPKKKDDLKNHPFRNNIKNKKRKKVFYI
jgi:hypothetical protein